MGVNGPLTLAPDKANLAFYLLEYFSLNYVAQKNMVKFSWFWKFLAFKNIGPKNGLKFSLSFGKF